MQIFLPQNAGQGQFGEANSPSFPDGGKSSFKALLQSLAAGIDQPLSDTGERESTTARLLTALLDGVKETKVSSDIQITKGSQDLLGEIRRLIQSVIERLNGNPSGQQLIEQWQQGDVDLIIPVKFSSEQSVSPESHAFLVLPGRTPRGEQNLSGNDGSDKISPLLISGRGLTIFSEPPGTDRTKEPANIPLPELSEDGSISNVRHGDGNALIVGVHKSGDTNNNSIVFRSIQNDKAPVPVSGSVNLESPANRNPQNILNEGQGKRTVQNTVSDTDGPGLKRMAGSGNSVQEEKSVSRDGTTRDIREARISGGEPVKTPLGEISGEGGVRDVGGRTTSGEWMDPHHVKNLAKDPGPNDSTQPRISLTEQEKVAGEQAANTREKSQQFKTIRSERISPQSVNSIDTETRSSGISGEERNLRSAAEAGNSKSLHHPSPENTVRRDATLISRLREFAAELDRNSSLRNPVEKTPNRHVHQNRNVEYIHNVKTGVSQVNKESASLLNEFREVLTRNGIRMSVDKPGGSGKSVSNHANHATVSARGSGGNGRETTFHQHQTGGDPLQFTGENPGKMNQTADLRERWANTLRNLVRGNERYTGNAREMSPQEIRYQSNNTARHAYEKSSRNEIQVFQIKGEFPRKFLSLSPNSFQGELTEAQFSEFFQSGADGNGAGGFTGSRFSPTGNMTSGAQNNSSGVMQQVVDRIQEMARQVKASRYQAHPGQITARLSLQPRHLGSVLLKLQFQENNLQGTIMTTSRESRQAIESQMPAIREALAQQNTVVQDLRVEVRPEGAGNGRDLFDQELAEQFSGKREHSSQGHSGLHTGVGTDSGESEMHPTNSHVHLHGTVEYYA